MSGEKPMPSEIPAWQFVDGFQLPAKISADVFRSIVQYKPRDDDVFIVNYPKCGTKLTQFIVVQILRHGKPLKTILEYLTASLFLEFAGLKAAETAPRPLAIKTHLPFNMIPWSDKAKYFYVAKNPKDSCISYYYLMENEFKGRFDQFFENFLSGNIGFGDYFDHLMGWYEHRNDNNVLFMTYEELKENPEASVLKLASFIDEEKYAKPLREDNEKLQNVLKYSSFKYIEGIMKKFIDEFSGMPEEEVLKSDLPEPLKKAFTSKSKLLKEVTKKPSISFVREGIPRNWKNFFNEDQSRRLDQKFAERTKGTDLPNLWKKYM